MERLKLKKSQKDFLEKRKIPLYHKITKTINFFWIRNLSMVHECVLHNLENMMVSLIEIKIINR